MMSGDGRFLVLSDRSVWQIRPDAQSMVAGGWRSGHQVGRRPLDTTSSYRWLLLNPVTRTTAPARLGRPLD